MKVEEMSKVIGAAQVGDTIHVRAASGRTMAYSVCKVGGRKARQLELNGRRGAVRVLVDGGDQIWIREASSRASDGSAHRRVMSLRNCTTALNERRPPSEPRSTGQILREMTIRDGGLPPGYDIDLGERGFRAMIIDGAGRGPVAEIRASAYIAAIDAWSHFARRQADLAGERWKCIAERAAADEQAERERHDRCGRALQQLSELLGGKPRSGKLFEGEPEQVVADVAHMLLSQARAPITNISIDMNEPDPERVLSMLPDLRRLHVAPSMHAELGR